MGPRRRRTRRPSEHSQIVQWLKGTSSRILFQELPHLKKQYWGRHLWASSVSTLLWCQVMSAVVGEPTAQAAAGNVWNWPSRLKSMSAVMSAIGGTPDVPRTSPYRCE